MRAGVVGEAEGPDNELARADGPDGAADFLDETAIFMAHGHGLCNLVQAAKRPEVRPTNAGRRQANDGVGGFEDFRLGNLLTTHVARSMKNSP